MKVFVAVPSYDAKINASCAQSLFRAAYHCAQADIELYPHFIHGGIFIDHVRSLIVRRFLETDCTHLFFIDADLGFESDALAGLVLADLPVTAGIYPKRTDGHKFNAKVHEPQEVKNGWLRMDRVATGFLCIQRKVLEEMSRKAPVITLGNDGEVPMVFHFDYEGDRFVGEDYAFCDDYNKQFSEPIWAYPDINFDHDGFTGNLHESLCK
jgi:hypothetical protein